MKKLKITNTIKTSAARILKSSYARLWICATLVVPTHSISPHGTVTYPPSRAWACYQEGPESPDSSACAAAIIGWGTQAFYDWNEVARMDAGGMHRDIIMDGNLASAGRPDKYGGLDQVRDDWVATRVTPGPLVLTWTNSAPHETLYYRVYITKADWTPDQPLTWDSLELLVETAPRPAAATDNIDVVLPQRTGKHVIYSVWQRSLTAEAFYSASDVDFGSGLVTNVAPEARFTTDNGTCGGSEVEFSAVDSYDDNGDDLTYTWDFGDGTTAQGIEVSHTYTNGMSSATVTLTVSDAEFSSGTTELVSLLRVQDCEELVVCPFDTPTAAPLPPVNETYKYAYVIGENGPDFSSMYKFFVNWDLANKGLYNFDYQTLTTYTSFLNLITHTFDSGNPEVTFSGTAIPGLDGGYFVTVDNGNLVMVSKTGDFTIYLSTTESAPDCGDEIPISVNGGTLTSEEKFKFVIADGKPDTVSGITLQGSVGESGQWIVADQSGMILELPNAPEDFNFDDSDEGRSYIYHLSYNGTLGGLAVGNNTFSITGDFDYSNSIEVTKVTEGSLSTENHELSTILKQNYPNPFSGRTTITYALDQKSEVRVNIYSIQGQLVKSFTKDDQGVGNHELTFDLSAEPAGIYLYTIEAQNSMETKRMILKK